MDDRGSLFFCVGAARCGKSTFCNKWVRETDIVNPRVIVCADNLRLALHGQRYCSRAEPAVFGMKYYMIEALLARGHDVIVDGTHTTRQSIQRLLELDKNAQPVIFFTKPEVCKARAFATGQQDLVPVIDRHWEQLQKLLNEEGNLDTTIKSILREIRYRRGG